MSLKRLVKESKEKASSGAAVGVPVQSPARLRIRQDLEHLIGISSTVQHTEDDFYNVYLTVTPTSGIWVGESYHFTILLTEAYPENGPKVRYTGPGRIYHPNIEGEELTVPEAGGRARKDWGVCAGLQREWKPSHNLNEVILSIETLFTSPNYDDSLPGIAKTAANVLRTDPKKFEEIAHEWMRKDYHRIE